MDPRDELSYIAREAKRDGEKKQRREKWHRRGQSFLRSFLFTENGKPKSGLMIYTFCLSFAFLGLYIAAFWVVIEALTEPLAGLNAIVGNALQSIAVGLLVSALSALMHVLLPDKRLAFGTHLWLSLYTIASVITLAIMLHDADAIRAMLSFALWFAVIPVAMGLGVTYFLYRCAANRTAPPEEKPAWKRYTERRD